MKAKQEQSIYKRASLKELLVFGSCEGLGFNIINMFTMTFFMYYVTNVYGITIATAGLIVAAARFFDAITDPIIGTVVDKTNTKWGRYRPFLVLGGLLFPLSTLMLFMGLDVPYKSIYLLIVYLLNSIGVTFLSVAVNSTRTLITTDPVQRVSLTVPAMLMTLFATLLINGVTVPLTQHFGDSISIWRIWAAILSLASFVAWFFFTLNIKKSDQPENYQNMTSEKMTFKRQLNVLKQNKPLQRLALASASIDLAAGFLSAVQIYFWLYVVNRMDMQPLSALVTIPILVVVSILMTPLAKKFSKKQLFLTGSILSFIIAGIMLIIRPFDNVYIVILFIGLASMANMLIQNVRFAMMADCVDYSEWKSDVQSAGVISSIYTFFNKVGNSIPAALSGVILGALGFVGGADFQTDLVNNGIVFLMFGGTMLAQAIAILAMKSYPITREFYAKMTSELKEKREKKHVS